MNKNREILIESKLSINNLLDRIDEEHVTSILSYDFQ